MGVFYSTEASLLSPFSYFSSSLFLLCCFLFYTFPAHSSSQLSSHPIKIPYYVIRLPDIATSLETENASMPFFYCWIGAHHSQLLLSVHMLNIIPKCKWAQHAHGVNAFLPKICCLSTEWMHPKELTPTLFKIRLNHSPRLRLDQLLYIPVLILLKEQMLLPVQCFSRGQYSW